MPETLANGASSTLNGAITISQTTVTIQTADVGKFPASGTYRIAVADTTNTELMTVTGGQGTATLTVTRASEAYAGAATAYAFASGSTVAQVLTSGGLAALTSTGSGGRVGRSVAAGGGAAALTISAIPGTGSILRVYHVGRGSGTFYSARLTFNGDTGANYDYQIMGANKVDDLNSEGFGQTAILVGTIAGSGSPTDVWGQSIIVIADYASAAHQKMVSASAGYKGSTASFGIQAVQLEGFWRSNAAITSVTITPSTGTLNAGSWLEAYVDGIGL